MSDGAYVYCSSNAQGARTFVVFCTDHIRPHWGKRKSKPVEGDNERADYPGPITTKYLRRDAEIVARAHNHLFHNPERTDV